MGAGVLRGTHGQPFASKSVQFSNVQVDGKSGQTGKYFLRISVPGARPCDLEFEYTDGTNERPLRLSPFLSSLVAARVLT